MNVDKLTDEQRNARALTIDEIADKIKAEYGEALATLGCIPVVRRVWDYSVEEYVESVRKQHGIELSAEGQRIQRDYLDVVSHATETELGFIVRIISALLDVDRLGMPHRGIFDEAIHILSFAETMLEFRVRRRRRKAREARRVAEELSETK